MNTKLDDRRIAFILCSNNEVFLHECFTYLSLLHIPEGYEVDTLIIPDARSMCAGYNEGMNASNAKYKIYLHQDTFIRHRDFLADILHIFASDPTIGMIGMVGAPKLHHCGVMWVGDRIGNFYRLRQYNELLQRDTISPQTDGLHDVEVVDGLMMITQYDLPWREDIFSSFHFYDVSQCLEFRRAGYRVVVPGQKTAWYIHDAASGGDIGDEYRSCRKQLIAAYPDFFPPERKHFLYCCTDVATTEHIPWGLLEMGHEISVDGKEMKIQDFDEKNKDEFAERLKKYYCDYVITHNLSPEIAQACYEVGVPYISWAYDSPLKESGGWFAEYPTTHAFCMDRKELARLKEEGKKHTHLEYMHLAGNVTRMQRLVISKEDEKLYGHQVSMVGSIYDLGFKDRYFEIIKDKWEADEEKKDWLCGELMNFVTEKVGDWRRDGTIFDRLSDEVVELLRVIYSDASVKYNFPNRRYHETLLAREITHHDRVLVLSELAKLYDVHLYTKSKSGIPENITVHPPVSAYVEAAKVYHLSKINLNISLRSIETGTPLRIFDVMSVGGFMLSNFQAELADLFVVDKEIVLYESIEELKDKVKYYLKHEDRRQRIAIAGHEKVKRCYSYPIVLDKIIKIVDEARKNMTQSPT
jgi:hypothetical protein